MKCFGRATPRLGSATPRHNRVGFALSRQGRQARYRLDVVDRADRRRQISAVNRRRIESSSIRVGAGRSEMFHCQRAQRQLCDSVPQLERRYHGSGSSENLKLTGKDRPPACARARSILLDSCPFDLGEIGFGQAIAFLVTLATAALARCGPLTIAGALQLGNQRSLQMSCGLPTKTPHAMRVCSKKE
jgi:hypothetical protein